MRQVRSTGRAAGRSAAGAWRRRLNGQQPGKPKPPGNPPDPRDPDERSPLGEPPQPIPVPRPEPPPVPLGALADAQPFLPAT